MSVQIVRCRICVCMLFIGICNTVLFAQSGRIKGKIIDGVDKNPLSFVNISIPSITMGTISDEQGQYALDQIPLGQYEVVFSYIGYTEIRREIRIEVDSDLRIDIVLNEEGEILNEVTVTAQALGQRAAINQQINADGIINVISKEKLQELPDQNAAESVGRISGIALQRDGGEATKVSIRGLSPRYNSITVNGERIPATDGNDRSVDLSMISTDALSGIEVFKSITPDQDGDAIGGSVNFVTKTAESGLRGDFKLLGGYNQQESELGQLRFNGSVSNRYFNEKLGLIAGVNYQRANRSSDLLTASYVTTGEDDQGGAIIQTENLNLADRLETRTRSGGNLSIDYRLPKGSLQFSSFIGLLDRDELRFRTRYRPEGSRKEYELRSRTTDQWTWNNTFNSVFNLDWLKSKLSIKGSYAITERNLPNERTWRFREDGAFLGTINESDLEDVVASAKNNLDKTFFQQLRIDETEINTIKTTVQVDYEIPLPKTDVFSAIFKIGGKLRYQERDRIASRLWSAFGAIDAIAIDFPDAFNTNSDGRINVTQFFGEHSAEPYLNNRYSFDFGQTLSLERLNQFTDTYKDDYFTFDERQNLQNYESNETVSAGYSMVNAKLFKNKLIAIAGFRYERTQTEFDGLFGRSFEADGQVFISAVDTVGNSNRDLWLPMFQLKYKAADWFDIRLASTRTLARPNFFDLIPWQQIDDINQIVQRGNPDLQLTEAQNYDLQFSFYKKYGLLTVGGFLKNLNQVDYQRISRDTDPNSATQGYQLITQENLETEVRVRGIEIDVQTQLSFLPKPWSGILLGGNITFMESETLFPLLEVIPGPPPFFIPEVRNTFRDGILPDQPNRVINAFLGYEIGGFSARLSMISQGRTLQFVGSREELDGYFSGFTRWDLALTQKVKSSIKIFLNVNNLSNTPEVITLNNTSFPVEEEFFGWTADIGFRYRFNKE